MINLRLLKKHYNTVLFFVTIIVVGIILGLILGIKQGPIFKNDLIYSTSNLKNAILTNNVNNILSHFFLLGLVIFTCLIMPLYFLNIIYLLFKGITIGFNIYIFTVSFGFKGLISSLIYNLTINLFYLSMFIFLLIKGNYLTKNILILLIDHSKDIFPKIKKTILAMLIIGSTILINDLILFFSSKVLLPKIFFLLG